MMKKSIIVFLNVKTLIKNYALKLLHAFAYLYVVFNMVNLANATENYLPDSHKLISKASQSKDLYVEPDFNFQTFNTYTLELNVHDQSGQPSPGVILRIFSTDIENELSDDEMPKQMSLLGLVRTDVYGSVYQTIEISQSVNQILVELNSQSPNNQVSINLKDKEYISHSFEVD